MSSLRGPRSRVRARLIPILVRVVVIVLLLVVGVSTFMALAGSRPEPKRVDAQELVRRVVYFESKPVEVARQWSGYATVRALRAADVPARITAPVVERPVGIERGAAVRAGELLIALDDADIREQIEVSLAVDREFAARIDELERESSGLRSRVEILAAQEAIAEAEERRTRTAQERGAATEREIDAAEQSLNRVRLERSLAEESLARIPARTSTVSAQRGAEAARRRLAEDQLARTRITAPMDGILQELDVEFGEQVTAGSRVARIVDPRHVEIALRLPARARRTVDVGDEVRLRSARDGGAGWSARVERIAPEDDPLTRTFAVYAVLERGGDHDGSSMLPAPGQFLQGTVASAGREPRSVVPRRAILGDRVMTIDAQGRLVGRRVEVDFQIERPIPSLGLPDLAWSVLREQLPPGTRIIAENSRRLFDGMIVEAVPSPASLPLTRMQGREGAEDRAETGGGVR